MHFSFFLFSFCDFRFYEDGMAAPQDAEITDFAYDFLIRALDLEPWSRLTADEGLRHQFLS